jgi:hypothetical protein
MSARRRFHLAGAGLGVAGLLLLAGCSPEQVGLTAVSQRDGHLVIAVVRCDDTALERVGVDHPGPLLGTDEPREHPDDGRWSTDQDEDDIIVLDTADPGGEWTTEMSLGSLDPAVHYSASARGDIDHSMGSVGFTTSELAALDEGQWLYDSDGDGKDHVVRPTTTDLADLRERRCH